METETSGCAGRRHRSAATGGRLHTPRWRFVRGSSRANWGQIPIFLNPPRWQVRRPPPVAALRCCRSGAPTIGAANEIDACEPCRYLRVWSKANPMARQQLANPHFIETDTSGCVGRRHRSAATGGGVHTPRWRFVRGSQDPCTQARRICWENNGMAV